MPWEPVPACVAVLPVMTVSWAGMEKETLAPAAPVPPLPPMEKEAEPAMAALPPADVLLVTEPAAPPPPPTD